MRPTETRSRFAPTQVAHLEKRRNATGSKVVLDFNQDNLETKLLRIPVKDTTRSGVNHKTADYAL